MNSIGIRLFPDALLGFSAGYGMYIIMNQLVFPIITGIVFCLLLSYIRAMKSNKK